MADNNSSVVLSEAWADFLKFEQLKAQCENQSPPTNDEVYCPAIFDGLLCWNHSKVGVIAQQFCPSIHDFNISALAYKTCLSTGEWLTKGGVNQSYTDYMACVPKASYSIYIYFAGYSMSIIALVVSLAVFFCFKHLTCHRITLHKNLLFCNLVNSTGWLLYFSVLAMHSAQPTVHNICQALYLIVNYTGTATYFWMLSEGLYLLLILIFTFNKGDAIVRLCIILGWGCPLLIITIFGSLRFYTGTSNLCHLEGFNKLMYIMLGPIFVTIILNIIFMLFILGILLNKLRNQHNIEQHRGRKAAKAILILTPVMGLHCLLTLVQPDNQILLKVHNYLSALTTSLQGFMVSMPFCFFNSEIHEAIRLKYRRWKNSNKARFTNNRYQNPLRLRTPKSPIALPKSCVT